MEINASGDNDVTACDGLPWKTLSKFFFESIISLT